MKNRLEQMTATYILLTFIFSILLLIFGSLWIKIISGLVILLFGYTVYLGAKYYIDQKDKE